MTAKTQPQRLTIALAQLNQRVGDLAVNATAMLEWRAKAKGADLVMFPELQLTGYPPEDLVLKPEFVRRSMEAAERLIDATADDGPAILFGSLHEQDGAVYNAMLLAEGGKLVARRLKHELPNYGTFDEKRVFAAGPLPDPVEWRGVKLGIPICEDIWLEPVCAALAKAGAEILLVPNGSPFELDKDQTRLSLVQARVTETGLPLVYLNRVGGQDELAFDGSSFVVNDNGQIALQMPDWNEALWLTAWSRTANGWTCAAGKKSKLSAYPEDIYRAMMIGLRDYVGRNGFPGILLGLSGGIDSALSAAIAVDALGAEKVWCVMLPSKYTSDDSLEDAASCAAMLRCRHDVIPIVPGV
ncbi:MAG: nitrilase-related carbon-nitrogen hydrolase, partial [Sphingomicrobium sp.]